MMFSGFTSRCTMPAACAADSALATWPAISMASRSDQLAAPQPLAKRLAVDELGDEERLAVHLVDVVDRQDRGMVQRRGGLGFLREAPQPFGVAGERGGQDLDGHLATEPRVVGRVDLAHAAFAEEADNAVLLQRRTRLEAHGHAEGL